jgi:hypothetical protein
VWDALAKSSKKYVQGYQLDGGPDSLRKLSEHLNMHHEYLILYNHLSKEVHGLNAIDSIKMAHEGNQLMGIRGYEGLETNLQYTLTYGIRPLRHFIFKVLKDDQIILNFNQIYLQKIRPFYLK